MERLEDLVKENIDLTRRAMSNALPNITSDDTQTTSKQKGQLVRTTSGHVRYLCTQHDISELARDLPSLDLPFSDMGVTTRQELLDLLPPLSRCDELKDVFMDVFSPLFHILHDPTFEAGYAAFRRNPREVELTFLALLFVVLAIGVTALDENHPLLTDLGREATAGANVRNIANRFRNAAMRTLTVDRFLWRHNLQTLQALILLIYALSHAHGPAWSLLGTTLNIAVAIGCHVDPSGYDVTIIEAEERRRCWAALLMLYTIQETSLGIQAPILIKANVKSPADIDDDELSRPAESNSVQVSGSKPPSKMTYILHKFKLYRLAAEICSSIASETHDETRTMQLDDMIMAEETKHQDCFAQFETLPLYHQAHYYILNSYTNHLYLILHSPVLAASSVVEAHGNEYSLRRLSEASLTILANYDTLRRTSAFQKYRWYADGLGSFHAFLAASTLVMMHGGAQRADSNASEAADALQRCLGHFRSAQSRSDICARAAAILSRLLGAQRMHEPQPYSPFFASTSSRAESGYESQDFQTFTAQSRVIPEDPVVGSRSVHDVDRLLIPPTNISDKTNSPGGVPDAGIDLNGWTASAEFQDFFCRIPTQQWLSPSLFPWSDWNEAENAYATA